MLRQVYKATNRAGDLWSQFEGVHDAKLFQIQLDHAARPSALFDIRGSFNEFLSQAAQGNEGFPKSLDDLAKGGVRLVVSDSTDPDGTKSYC